jgi:hypothetical protein
VQILRYAACCLDMLGALGEHDDTEAAVLAALARAHSNDPDEGDGRAVWRRHVEASRVDPGRVAAHLAMTELLARDRWPAEAGRLDGYDVSRDLHDAVDRGGVAVCAGRVVLTHRRTRRTTGWTYAALHLGGLEVFGAVRPGRDGDPGGDADDIAALVEAARGGDRVTTLLRLVVDRFGPREFGLESALPGVGEDLLRATAEGLADRFVAAYDQLRADHHDTLTALAVAGTPLPTELRGPVEHALARRLEAAVGACTGSTDPDTYRLARAVARQSREQGVRIASPRAGAALGRAIDRAVAVAAGRPSPATVDAARGMVRLARELGQEVSLDVAQERVYDALTRPGPQDGSRELLAPLAQQLGVSPRPIDVPG